MVPIVLLMAAIALLFLWLKRKIRGKSFSPVHLQLNEDEMRLLERASSKRSLISINGKECLLQAFSAEKQHIHSNCESCPDELRIDDTQGQAQLAASREPGSTTWRVTAIEPVALGLLGHTSSDLTDLRIDGQPIGQVDDIT